MNHHSTYPRVIDMRNDISRAADLEARIAWAKENPLAENCGQCKPTSGRTLKECPHPQHNAIDRTRRMYDDLVRGAGYEDGTDTKAPDLASEAAAFAAEASTPKQAPKGDAAGVVVEALGLEPLIRATARDEIAKQGGLELSGEIRKLRETGEAMADDIRSTLREGLDEMERRATSYKGVEIVSQDGERVKLEGHHHEAFAEAFDLLLHSPNGCIYLVGPAGTGKTHLAKQLSDAFNAYKGTAYPFACDSLNEGTPESFFTTWLLPTGDGGRFESHATGYTRSFENGGVYCGDEFDRMDANVASVLNKGLDSDTVDIPKRVENPRMVKHEDHRFIAIGNTVGAGGSSLYGACNQQDGATMNRFGSQMVYIGYDHKLERALAIAEAGGDIPAAEKALTLAARMRDAIERGDLEQIASYRQTRVNAGKYARANAYRKEGRDVPAHLTDERIRESALASWSEDERAMVSK